MAEEDIIFGKNRHLFGGIEPSNMSRFSLKVVGSTIGITAELPNDTVINGQVICSVGGAVIVRRTDRYPLDEFDGQIVRDIKKSEVFNDSGVSTSSTYYYAAFPYSKQGVYNRSEANRCCYRAAETISDLEVSCKWESNTYKIQARYQKPSNTSSVLFVGSFTDYPDSPSKGIRLNSLSSSGYLHVKTLGKDDIDFSNGDPYLYVSAFSIDSRGMANHQPAKAKVKIQKYGYLFGYDLNISDSNPKTRVSYPSDVQNMNYTPAKMNFSRSVFENGSWILSAGETFNPKPCMVDTRRGLVEYYLNPNDYSKKLQNNQNSDIANRDSGLVPMVEWPKIYTKRWLEGHTYKFRCSDVKIDDTWDCWNFYDISGDEIDNFYTSIFQVTNYENRDMRLVSYAPGAYQSVRPYTDINFEDFVDIVSNAFGYNCTLFQYADLMLIQDLLVMISKSTNLKEAFGEGSANGTDLGSGNNKGMFWAARSTEANHRCNKVFGIENLWGYYGSYILGCFIVDGSLNVKITTNTKDGTKTTEFGKTGIGYLTYPLSRSYSGYINKMHVTPFGRMPDNTGGSSTTYECDYLNCNNWSNGTTVCVYYGPFGMSFTNPKATDRSCGVRLTMKPQK